LLYNPIDEPTKTVTLVGIADYLNSSSHPVVVKIETGLVNDLFVGFNRATGANAQNDEGDDLVTVIQVDQRNGEGYSQSYLKAKLGFVGDRTGESYTILDFGGTGNSLTITALSIDLSVNPAIATVKFEYNSITSNPTSSPTKSPTVSPTSSPTKSPVASTSSPTKSPTISPTSAPTKSPVASTSSPTGTPTILDTCIQYTKAKDCKNANCNWLGGSLCVSYGVSPSPTPPSPSPPTGGTCSNTSCSFCAGGGECRTAGCSWTKGNCA
jgi:cell division septation protein DedD